MEGDRDRTDPETSLSKSSSGLSFLFSSPSVSLLSSTVNLLATATFRPLSVLVGLSSSSSEESRAGLVLAALGDTNGCLTSSSESLAIVNLKIIKNNHTSPVSFFISYVGSGSGFQVSLKSDPDSVKIGPEY